MGRTPKQKWGFGEEKKKRKSLASVFCLQILAGVFLFANIVRRGTLGPKKYSLPGAQFKQGVLQSKKKTSTNFSNSSHK